MDGDNSQQMGYIIRNSIPLANRQVSVLALRFLTMLDGIVRGMLDEDYN